MQDSGHKGLSIVFMLKGKSLSPSLLCSSAYWSDIKNLENSWLVLVSFFLIRSLICSLI